ncbi:MAG: hypothetical protein QW625_02735 [Candidatus Nanoarchaeia archaeon]
MPNKELENLKEKVRNLAKKGSQKGITFRTVNTKSFRAGFSKEEIDSAFVQKFLH